MPVDIGGSRIRLMQRAATRAAPQPAKQPVAPVRAKSQHEVAQGRGPTFKIGDKAVYPGQGVAEVMGIEHLEVAGQRQSFYKLKVLENNMIIRIPVNKVDMVGLREIIDEAEAAKVYKILREKEVSVDSTTWNRRYREYMEKIKTGSPYEIAEVLRDLYLLKYDKDLSFGERKMLDTARSLLVKELSIARSVNEEQIEGDLKRIFNC
jgi:CarD family transcriptional regulator